MSLVEVQAIGDPKASVVCLDCEQPSVLFHERGSDWWIKDQAEKQAFVHFQQQPEHKVIITLFNSWPLK